MEEIIDRWKLNRNLLASKMEMPKGTFNNKLNKNHSSTFSDDEWEKLKQILLDLRDELNDLDAFNAALSQIAKQNV